MLLEFVNGKHYSSWRFPQMVVIMIIVYSYLIGHVKKEHIINRPLFVSICKHTTPLAGDWGCSKRLGRHLWGVRGLGCGWHRGALQVAPWLHEFSLWKIHGSQTWHGAMFDDREVILYIYVYIYMYILFLLLSLLSILLFFGRNSELQMNPR